MVLLCLICVFANTFYFFACLSHLFQMCSELLIETFFCYGCFTVYQIILAFLASIFSTIIFFIQFYIFLAFGMISAFQMKPGHFGYYAIRFWILFKPVLFGFL